MNDDRYIRKCTGLLKGHRKVALPEGFAERAALRLYGAPLPQAAGGGRIMKAAAVALACASAAAVVGVVGSSGNQTGEAAAPGEAGSAAPAETAETIKPVIIQTIAESDVFVEPADVPADAEEIADIAASETETSTTTKQEGTTMRMKFGRLRRKFMSSASAAMLMYMGAQANQNDPYIECDGTSGISTGYRMKGGVSRVEVDFALTDPDHCAQMRVFGTAINEVEPSLGMMLYMTGQSGGTTAGFLLRNIVGVTVVTNDAGWVSSGYDGRFTVVDDLKNGVAEISAGDYSQSVSFATSLPSYAGRTANLPLSLFGSFSNTNATKFLNLTGQWDARIAKAKVYGVKIYENYDPEATDNSANLVHDYVPCLRDDGVACLKDLVTGGFIVGENPGAFTAGGNAPEYPDNGYISTAANANGAKIAIDTGYQISKDTSVEIDCALAEALVGQPANTMWYLFDGTRGSNRFEFNFDNSSISFLRWSALGNELVFSPMQWWNAAAFPKPTAAYDFRSLRRTYTLDSFNKKISVATYGFMNASTNFEAAASFNNYSGSSTLKISSYVNGKNYNAAIKIYGCRIYEAGTLVRNFVPYVNSGVAGLYETETTHKFYPAVDYSGSGAAAGYGGVVAGEDDAYIESNGTTGLSTGYKMKGAISRVEVDFQLTSTAGQQYVFGCGSLGETKLQTFLYTTGGTSGDSFKFCQRPYANNANDSQWVTTIDTNRHLAVTDMKNMKNIFNPPPTNTTVTVRSFKYDFAGITADLPLPIFAKFANDAGTTFNSGAHGRIYSVRIYENYDETVGAVNTPVHEFLPFSKGGQIGFRDTVTTNTIVCPANSGFSFGGVGYNHGCFKPIVTPGYEKTATQNRDATLNVFCPGVDTFRWYMDGEAIPGASGDTYAAKWTSGGETNEYWAASVFTLYGTEREGEPTDPIAIGSSKLGMAIYFK